MVSLHFYRKIKFMTAIRGLSSSSLYSPSASEVTPPPPAENKPHSPLNSDRFESAPASSPLPCAAPAPQPPSFEQQWANALEQVYSHFELLEKYTLMRHEEAPRTNSLSLDDLKSISSLDFPDKPELQAALRFFRENSSAIQSNLSASGLRSSSKFNRIDIMEARNIARADAQRASMTPPAESGGPANAGGATNVGGSTEVGLQTEKPYDQQRANALTWLNQYSHLVDIAHLGEEGGWRFQAITEEKLRATLNNPGLPAELHEACRFFLNNPEAFKSLDLAGEGAIRTKTLAQAAQTVPAHLRPPLSGDFDQKMKHMLNQLYQNFHLLDTAISHEGKPTDNVGFEQMRAALNKPDLPPALREACQFFVENPVTVTYLNAQGPGLMPYASAYFTKLGIEKIFSV